MRILFTVLTFTFFGLSVIGQCPYQEAKYEVRSKENLLYAVDTSFDGTLDSLYLDIYTPLGDQNAARPMMIWIHGGGFFGGNKESFRKFCKSFAAEGFACATVSYRLGFYPPQVGNASNPFSYDKAEPIRAGYRAMQDIKAAIRFIKARHQEDSTDINHFILTGASAGGIAALTAANIIHPEDKYDVCKQIEPVIGQDTAYPRPDLGPVEGKFNLNGYDAKVEGVISIFGGIIKPEFLSSSYPKHYFFYHQTLDPIVPCETNNGYWLAPVLKDNYPKISGGCSLLEYLDQHPPKDKVIMPFIVEGVEHGIHDMSALLDSIHVFLNQVICEPITADKRLHKGKSLSVFPQPAGNRAMILWESDRAIKKVELIDMSGISRSLRFLFEPSEHRIYLDIASIPKGFYLIKITDNTDANYLVKMIK